jgi:hypothetical protein
MGVGFTFERYTFEENCCNALKEFLKSNRFMKKFPILETSLCVNLFASNLLKK